VAHHVHRIARLGAWVLISEGWYYTPELQPAETLWELVDEPLINKHIATIEALEDIVANRCRALAEQPTIIKSRTGFHWWPKIAVPK